MRIQPKPALALVLILCLALAATQAGAEDPAPVPIAAGAGADWGLKQSFRNYIEGHIAGGTITASEGAIRNPDGSFHFPLVSGSYDPATQSTVVQFAGRVLMEGHGGALELNVADPRIELTPLHARILADVTSRPIVGGAPVVYPDAVFATLDLSGVDPTIDAVSGTTSWSQIPAYLAAGAVDAFAGHYSVGIPLDSFSFAYDGPGGEPLPPVDNWTEPGKPIFGVVASTTLANVAVGALEPDPANGVVHAVGRVKTSGAGNPTAYRALKADTLSAVAALDDPTVTWSSDGQIPITRRTALVDGTLYGLSIAGPVQRTRFAAGAYVQDGTIGTSTGTAANHIAVAPGAARLYIAAGSTATTGYARTLTRSGSDWIEASHAYDAAKGLAADLAVDTDGAVLETHRLSTLVKRPVAILDFSVDPIGRTEIADTEPATGFGLQLLALAPGGVVYAAERDAPISRLQKIVKAPSGYVASGPLLDLNVKARKIAVDASDGTLWVGAQGANGKHPLLAVREGAIVGSVTLPGSGDQVAAADGTTYVANASGTVWAIRRLGVTPSITADLEDATATLSQGESSEAVTFTAAATGTPIPTVRWQRRPTGATAFVDIEGETASTLEVEAEAIDDHTTYRAVFSNSAEAMGETVQIGEIATDPATLTVNTAPEVLAQPEDVAVIEGEDALFKALPSGNPYPEVIWQRRVGGFWQPVDPESGDFEVNGGALLVREANPEMSGSRFRAKLANSVGADFSDAAILTVSQPPPTQVSFGSGQLDWGVKQSFRDYINGPIAHGSYTASSGATVNPDGTIRFDVLGGTYDTLTGEGEIATDGTVRFSGHQAPGMAPLLDLRITDPRIELEGDTGTLFADVESKGLADGQIESYPGVALATLDLSAAGPAPIVEGLAFAPIAAVLSEAGVPAFAEFYPAGSLLDPLSLEAVFGEPREPPAAPPTDTPTDLPTDPQATEAQLPAAASPSATAGEAPKAKRLRCKAGKRKRKLRRSGRVRCVAAKGGGRKLGKRRASTQGPR
jgi:Htaa